MPVAAGVATPRQRWEWGDWDAWLPAPRRTWEAALTLRFDWTSVYAMLELVECAPGPGGARTGSTAALSPGAALRFEV